MSGPSRSRPSRRWLVTALGLGATLLVAGALGVSALAPGRGSTQAMAPPRFVDDTGASGLDHSYDGEYSFFVGGGVAVFDCNADERPELYVAGGVNPAALFQNDSVVGSDLRFSRLPDAATDLPQVTGAYPLDVDSDDHVDLAVLRLGENVLLRGLGDCRFERANERWNVDGGMAWTTAFSGAWEPGVTMPMLAFGNYLQVDGRGDVLPAYDCAENQLYRPVGEATSYQAATPLSPGWCTLSALFSDWARDGRRDLRFSNDRHYYGWYGPGEEQLWQVVPGRQPRPYTAADGWQTVRIWGMGIASQDLTGDGLPEIYLTSQGDNKLHTLVASADAGTLARPQYRDVAIERRATAHKPFIGGDVRPSTAWHAEFDDVNNDAYMDLFVAKGNVEAIPDYAAMDPSNLLLGQADGTFREGAVDSGTLTFERGRGGAVVDLNLDGQLDLVEVIRRQNVRVWRNTGPTGHWIAVRLEQPAPNVDAIGAWLEVRAGGRTISRELTVGGGHVSGQLGWSHVGLGTSGSADVRVTWPDGDASPWHTVSADTFQVIARGSAPRPWTPAP